MKIYYLALLAILSGCAGQPQNAPPKVAQQMPVIKIESEEATIFQEYPAAVEGMVNIEIRPQVEGILKEVLVEDGAYVAKGQPLFRIDPAPFEERLRQAQASLKVAQGAYENAQIDVEKQTELVTGKVVSDIQLRESTARRDVASGNVEQAKADIGTARINLGYTQINAPISGYIGRLARKNGSIVAPADPIPLTDLSDVHEVHVFFALGEYDFIRFKEQYAGATLAAKVKNLPPVDLILADDSAYALKGRIDAINGHFDSNTGAITFRATFKNGNGLLRSGNTGKVRLGLKLSNQLIVPEAATMEMQEKVFVFLVGGGNKVIRQEITVSGKAGNNYLVKDGLKPGDEIVLRGYDHLSDGDVIVPKIVDTTFSLASNN
jgi:RND family efflux transporter MFP subunit